MTYTITESERKRILGLYGLDTERNYLKENLAKCKFTKDGKYILFENNVYSSETGDLMPLNEKWTLSDTFHTIADLSSAGLDFVFPGSGAVIDTLNAISYIIEAQFKPNPKDRRGLYAMATLTFAFVIIPGALQTSITPIKVAMKTGKGFEKPLVKKGLSMVAKTIDKVVLGIPRLVSKALNSKFAVNILKRFKLAWIGKVIDNFIAAIKTSVDDILGIAAREGVEAGGKAATKATVKGAAEVGAKTLSRISIASMKKFFTNLPQIAKGTYVMKKFGFAVGKEYGYIVKAGSYGQKVKIIGASGNGVIVKNALGGAPYNVPINQFLKGTIGNPWARKAYSEVTPLFIRSFARLILPDGSGLNYNKLEQMADLNPDQTSMESLAYLRDELASYEGTQGQYTINPTAQAFQTALLQLGYQLPRFGADGKFGPETQAALKQFQLDNMLETSSGKMDRLTAKRLALMLLDKGVQGSEGLQNQLNSI